MIRQRTFLAYTGLLVSQLSTLPTTVHGKSKICIDSHDCMMYGGKRCAQDDQFTTKAGISEYLACRLEDVGFTVQPSCTEEVIPSCIGRGLEATKDAFQVLSYNQTRFELQVKEYLRCTGDYYAVSAGEFPTCSERCEKYCGTDNKGDCQDLCELYIGCPGASGTFDYDPKYHNVVHIRDQQRSDEAAGKASWLQEGTNERRQKGATMCTPGSDLQNSLKGYAWFAGEAGDLSAKLGLCIGTGNKMEVEWEHAQRIKAEEAGQAWTVEDARRAAEEERRRIKHEELRRHQREEFREIKRKAAEVQAETDRVYREAKEARLAAEAHEREEKQRKKEEERKRLEQEQKEAEEREEARRKEREEQAESARLESIALAEEAAELEQQIKEAEQRMAEQRRLAEAEVAEEESFYLDQQIDEEEEEEARAREEERLRAESDAAAREIAAAEAEAAAAEEARLEEERKQAEAAAEAAAAAEADEETRVKAAEEEAAAAAAAAAEAVESASSDEEEAEEAAAALLAEEEARVAAWVAEQDL